MINRLSALTDDLGIAYGGDYNPEQWDASIWHEDVRLMKAAGVNLATVGVFSWARIEPRPGSFDFAWLDEVLDLLHSEGIAVDLATPVASPPPWLAFEHPETLPTDADGIRLSPGSRNHFCPSAPAYRDAARRIARAVVERYHDHPAVAMWHAGNEYGQHCYCDLSAEAFRVWLRGRYGDLDTLNARWATDVWSQRFARWEEILPPRRAPYHRNPALELDYRRFSSDELLSLYAEQRDVIRAVDPERLIATNLMGFSPVADYASWAPGLEVIADDAYPDPAGAHGPSAAALTNHLARGLKGGSWMRMEQAASAVSWRPHNLTKSPERIRLEVLQAIAHGCDAVAFFQWRQARSGPERFHSAMLPIAGDDTDVHRGIRRIGAELPRLRPVVGADVPARVAMLWDWTSWWAATQDALPTQRLDPLETLHTWHRVLWERGIVVDVVTDTRRLSAYDLVVAPVTYILDPRAAEDLRRYVTRGGVLVWGPFCGVADEHGTLWTGRSPSLLRDVLGASSEEWVPLPDQGSEVTWADGSISVATTFGERTRAEGAEAIAVHSSGPLATCAAVTRHDVGDGTAWYVGAVLGPRLATVLEYALDDADIPTLPVAPGVEVVLRGDHLFLLNHGEHAHDVDLDALARALPAAAGLLAAPDAHDALRGTRLPSATTRAQTIPPHDAVVITRVPRPTAPVPSTQGEK